MTPRHRTIRTLLGTSKGLATVYHSGEVTSKRSKLVRVKFQSKTQFKIRVVSSRIHMLNRRSIPILREMMLVNQMYRQILLNIMTRLVRKKKMTRTTRRRKSMRINTLGFTTPREGTTWKTSLCIKLSGNKRKWSS